MKHKIYRTAAAAFAVAVLLSGCGKTPVSNSNEPVKVSIQTESEGQAVVDGMEQLTPDGPDYERLKDLPVPETEPAPEYLRLGVEHEKISELQARLMELGFMDNDEPTEYFGNVTQEAVKTFQRQNKLNQDGIVGPATWDAIMDPNAKYYAAQNGDQGSDIERIQKRLYELGYLATADLVTGNFGEKTEEAVKKMQQVNGLDQDGKVGRRTVNLLYSEDVKPNLLVYGDKSEVVEAAQKRLKELGYLTTEPDGTYGNDTSVALKQFQSRNDLVVDGYLGPSTRAALNDPGAVANGLVLGDQGDSVKQVQNLLSKYGYLSSSNVTGYFGDKTESAVKSFQSNNGLASDGSVGRMTMAKLTSNDVKKSTGSSSSSSGSSGKSNSSSSGGSKGSVGGSGVSGLLSIASSKLGSPYVWGAKGPNSFDCSGFVYWCLNKAGVKQSYTTSSGWRNIGKYTKITNFNSLQAGDIIVVSGHVGIVAGGGTVIDASSSNGKVVHRSLSSWWRNNFICGWRIF